MQTYMEVLNIWMHVWYISVECVSNIKLTLLINLHVIYVIVCIQLAHFSCDGCEDTCTLSYDPFAIV